MLIFLGLKRAAPPMDGDSRFTLGTQKNASIPERDECVSSWFHPSSIRCMPYRGKANPHQHSVTGMIPVLYTNDPENQVEFHNTATKG